MSEVRFTKEDMQVSYLTGFSTGLSMGYANMELDAKFDGTTLFNRFMHRNYTLQMTNTSVNKRYRITYSMADGSGERLLYFIRQNTPVEAAKKFIEALGEDQITWFEVCLEE